MTEQQETIAERIERAKGRKLRHPIQFIVQAPASDKPIIIGGVPRVRMQMEMIEVETIGDMTELYKLVSKGKVQPIPDLSLQVLNIMLDLLGMIEPSGEATGASDVGAGPAEGTGATEGN
jgi:hypothetical protein